MGRRAALPRSFSWSEKGEEERQKGVEGSGAGWLLKINFLSLSGSRLSDARGRLITTPLRPVLCTLREEPGVPLPSLPTSRRPILSLALLAFETIAEKKKKSRKWNKIKKRKKNQSPALILGRGVKSLFWGQYILVMPLAFE